MDYNTFQKSHKFIPYGLENAPEYEIFDRYLEMLDSEGGLTLERLRECFRSPQEPPPVKKTWEERFREADEREEERIANHEFSEEDSSEEEGMMTEDVVSDEGMMTEEVSSPDVDFVSGEEASLSGEEEEKSASEGEVEEDSYSTGDVPSGTVIGPKIPSNLLPKKEAPSDSATRLWNDMIVSVGVSNMVVRYATSIDFEPLAPSDESPLGGMKVKASYLLPGPRLLNLLSCNSGGGRISPSWQGWRTIMGEPAENLLVGRDEDLTGDGSVVIDFWPQSPRQRKQEEIFHADEVIDDEEESSVAIRSILISKCYFPSQAITGQLPSAIKVLSSSEVSVGISISEDPSSEEGSEEGSEEKRLPFQGRKATSEELLFPFPAALLSPHLTKICISRTTGFESITIPPLVKSVILESCAQLHTVIASEGSKLKYVKFRYLYQLYRVVLPSTLESLAFENTPVYNELPQDLKSLVIVSSSIKCPTNLPSNLERLVLSNVRKPGLLGFPLVMGSLTKLDLTDIPVGEISLETNSSGEADLLNPFLLAVPKLEYFGLKFRHRLEENEVDLSEMFRWLKDLLLNSLTLYHVRTVIKGLGSFPIGKATLYLPDSLTELRLTNTNIEVIKNLPRGLKVLSIVSNERYPNEPDFQPDARPKLVSLPPLPYGIEILDLHIHEKAWKNLYIPSSVKRLSIDRGLKDLVRPLPRNFAGTVLDFSEDVNVPTFMSSGMMVMLRDYPLVNRLHIYNIVQDHHTLFYRDLFRAKLRLCSIFWRIKYRKAYNIIVRFWRRRVLSLKAKAKLIATEIDATLGSNAYHKKKKEYRGIMLSS
jgi:hypothetical protein